MLMALVPDTRMPARAVVPSRVIDFVIVTAPNPPGSSTSISPIAAVLEIAPANVLHGAVRLQGFASSPTPDTHVRDACAQATLDQRPIASAMNESLNDSMNLPSKKERLLDA